jgi:DegV family protein with EDD domain
MDGTLTAGRTGLVLDSTSDAPQLAERPEVRIVPLTVSFGDQDYRDHVDLDPPSFYARLAASKVTPTTAAPSPQAFADAYRELLDAGYEHVLSLQISGRLSATVESARLGAADLGGRVTVLDSRSASAGIALCALKVLQMLEQGTTLHEVEAYVGRFAEAGRLLFSVETLEYLQRGGRLGKAQALLGGLLSVRPVLSLRDGEVVPIARVRGRAKVLAAIGEQLDQGTTDGLPLRFAVAHADAPDTARELVELVRRIRPDAVLELVGELGAVIGTYGGPGAFGVMWVPEPPTNARAEPPAARAGS